MKRNQLPNIYGENTILPPPMKGTEVSIPPNSKVPTIVPKDFEDPIYDQLAELSKKYMASGHEERQKKMKQQEIENLKRLLEDHEEEMIQDRRSRTPTMPSPQTPSRQTELSDPVSFRDTELDTGPGNRTEISDPEVFRPTSLVMSGRLYDMFEKYSSPPPHTKSPIRPPRFEDEEIEVSIPSLGKLPVVEDLSEEELTNWDEFVALNKRKKERQEGYLGEESKLSPEEGTVPPPRKKADVEPDHLLRLCSQYHDLCCKL